MKINIVLSALLLAASLSAASQPLPLPDMPALWKAYQQNPPDSYPAWESAVAQINDQVEEQILQTNTQYCELVQQFKTARDQLTEITNKLLSTGKLKTLYDQLQQSGEELNQIAPEDNRFREMDFRDQEVSNLKNQINYLLKTDEQYGKLLERKNQLRQELTTHGTMLINESALPVAKVFLDTRKLAAEGLEPDELFLVISERGQPNPFAGMYQTISHERAQNSVQSGYIDFIINSITRENPTANPEKIANYARFRATQMTSYPKESPDFLTPGSNGFEDLYNISGAYYREMQNKNEIINRLQKLLQNLRSPSYTRLFALQFLHKITGTSKVANQTKVLIGKELEKLILLAGPGSEASPFLYNYYCVWADDQKQGWQHLDEITATAAGIDPWLRQMIIGHAAKNKAWRARGGGFSNTVTQQGWKDFDSGMEKSREAFEAAAKIRPDRPQSYAMLIPITMASCGRGQMIGVFKKMIEIDPFFTEGYNDVRFGLLPRWCGSIKLILQLGDAALDYPYYDTVIPAYGFDSMGYAAVNYRDYRWKNIYLRNGIVEKGDRLFDQCDQAESRQYWKNFLLYHRALFEMATLRYDQATKTVELLGGESVFFDCHQEYRWNGHGTTYRFPRMPQSRDNSPPVLLRLFTGQYQQELRSLEKRFLAGEDETVCNELMTLIKTGKFTPEERQTLIDLYGRWAVNYNLGYYNGNAWCYAVYVSAVYGYPHVFKNIIEMGFDYSQNHRYPGQLAIQIAQEGTDPEDLDVLKAHGDPLNRPDPPHKHNPLHAAAQFSNAVMVKKMLELGSPVDQPDGDNHTALQLSAAVGGVETTRILLAAGADLEYQDNDGDTALMFTMQQNGPRLLWEMLIRPAKNINLANHEGDTALHYAGRYQKQPDAIRALLAAGADPKQKNNKNETPADLARQRGRADLADILDGKQK